MKKLTQRQKTVLDIISKLISDRGYPPTLKELAKELGVSSQNSSVKHLTALAKKGFIVWEKNKARGIKLMNSYETPGIEESKISLPLVGAVTAGLPMLAEENN